MKQSNLDHNKRNDDFVSLHLNEPTSAKRVVPVAPDHYQRIEMLCQYARIFQGAIELGFAEYTKYRSPFRVFIRKNYSLISNWGNKLRIISPELITCSQGSLVPPYVTVTYSDDNEALEFMIHDQPYLSNSSEEDKIGVVCFDPVNMESFDYYLGCRKGNRKVMKTCLWERQKTPIYIYCFAYNESIQKSSSSTIARLD